MNVQAELGFHATVTGSRRGLGNYFQRLDEAGKRFVIVSVDDAGLVEEACSYTNADHWVVFRSNHDLNGVELDVPKHSGNASNYTETAQSYWARLKAKLESYAQVVAHKNHIWIAALNELDDTQPEYLNPFMLELAMLMNEEGWKVIIPSWATGNNEFDNMERQNHLDLLRYCGENRDKCLYGIHEYSLDDDLFFGYPYLVGRWTFYVDVCREFSIPEPFFFVKEFGWHATKHMNPDYAMGQLRDLMNTDEPGIPRAIWDFSNTQTEDLIKPITQLILDESFKSTWTPSDNGVLKPDMHYKVVYNLIPNDITEAEYEVILSLTFPSKETVGFSADDAGFLVSEAGNEDSFVKAWFPERIGAGITQAWFDQEYPGATMLPCTLTEQNQESIYPYFGIHGPGSDWIWNNLDFRSMMSRLAMPTLFLSVGINKDFASYADPLDSPVRLFFNLDRQKDPQELWNEIKNEFAAWYTQGYRKFVPFNEVNIPDWAGNGVSEGLGVLWDSPEEFSDYLNEFVTIVNMTYSDIQWYFTPMSTGPGLGWRDWLARSWPSSKHLFHGICVHAYAGNNGTVEQTIDTLISGIQEYLPYANGKPVMVGELSVNRGTNTSYKAAVYRGLEERAAELPGVESVYYFIAQWTHLPEHGEAWFGSDLPNLYLQ